MSSDLIHYFVYTKTHQTLSQEKNDLIVLHEFGFPIFHHHNVLILHSEVIGLLFILFSENHFSQIIYIKSAVAAEDCISFWFKEEAL